MFIYIYIRFKDEDFTRKIRKVTPKYTTNSERFLEKFLYILPLVARRPSSQRLIARVKRELYNIYVCIYIV